MLLSSLAKLMLPNTSKVVMRTWDDIKFFKRLCKLLEFLTVAFCALYQIYIIATGSNIWYIHLALLILSLAHFIYKLAINKRLKDINASSDKKSLKRQAKKELKLNRKRMGNVYTVTSILLRTFVIATSVYSIIVDPRIFKVICTTLVIAELIVEILIRIVVHLVEKRFNKLMSTFNSEFESIKNKFSAPVNTAKDIYSTVVKSFSNNDNPVANVIGKVGNWFKTKSVNRSEIYIDNTDVSTVDDATEETV